MATNFFFLSETSDQVLFSYIFYQNQCPAIFLITVISIDMSESAHPDETDDKFCTVIGAGSKNWDTDNVVFNVKYFMKLHNSFQYFYTPCKNIIYSIYYIKILFICVVLFLIWSIGNDHENLSWESEQMVFSLDIHKQHYHQGKNLQLTVLMGSSKLQNSLLGSSLNDNKSCFLVGFPFIVFIIIFLFIH